MRQDYPPRRLIVLIACCLALWLSESVSRSQERDTPAGGGGEAILVREGFLVNMVHRYYFPLNESWRTDGDQEADFQVLRHASLPGVVLKVLVAPGNPLPLDQTMRALRERVAEDRRLHVIEESRRRAAGREAGQLLVVREGGGADDPLSVLRTVTFVRDDAKYYLRLEAPADKFEAASRDFVAAVEGFRFEFRMPWQKRSH